MFPYMFGSEITDYMHFHHFSCFRMCLEVVYVKNCLNQKQKKKSRDSQHMLFISYKVTKWSLPVLTDKIVCVGYPATSYFSVLTVLKVTTSRNHLPTMLGKYRIE